MGLEYTWKGDGNILYGVEFTWKGDLNILGWVAIYLNRCVRYLERGLECPWIDV